MSKKLPNLMKVMAVLLLVLGFSSMNASAQTSCYVTELGAGTMDGSIANPFTLQTALQTASCTTIYLNGSTFDVNGNVSVNRSVTFSTWNGTSTAGNNNTPVTATITGGNITLGDASTDVFRIQGGLDLTYASEDSGAELTLNGRLSSPTTGMGSLTISEGASADALRDFVIGTTGSLDLRNFDLTIGPNVEAEIMGNISLRGDADLVVDPSASLTVMGSTVNLNDTADFPFDAANLQLRTGTTFIINEPDVAITPPAGDLDGVTFVFLSNTVLDLQGLGNNPFTGDYTFEFRGNNQVELDPGQDLTTGAPYEGTFYFSQSTGTATVHVNNAGVLSTVTFPTLVVERTGGVILSDDDLQGSATTFNVEDRLHVRQGTLNVTSNYLVYSHDTDTQPGGSALPSVPYLLVNGTVTGTSGELRLDVTGSNRFQALGTGTIDVLFQNVSSTDFTSADVAAPNTRVYGQTDYFAGNEVFFPALDAVTITGGAVTLRTATAINGNLVVDGTDGITAGIGDDPRVDDGAYLLLWNVGMVEGTVDIENGSLVTRSSVTFDEMVNVYENGALVLMGPNSGAATVTFDDDLMLNDGSELFIGDMTGDDAAITANEANGYVNVVVNGDFTVGFGAMVTQASDLDATSGEIVFNGGDITLNSNLLLGRVRIAGNVDLERATGDTTSELTIGYGDGTIPGAITLGPGGDLNIDDEGQLVLTNGFLVRAGGTLSGETFLPGEGPLQVNYTGNVSQTTGLETSGGVGTIVVDMTGAPAAQLIIGSDVRVRSNFVFLNGTINLNTYDLMLGGDPGPFTFVRGDGVWADATESSVVYDAGETVNLIYVNRGDITADVEWPSTLRPLSVTLRNYTDLAAAHGMVTLPANRMASDVNVFNGTLNIGAYTLDVNDDITINGDFGPGTDPAVVTFPTTIPASLIPSAIVTLPAATSTTNLANVFRGQIVAANDSLGVIRFTGTDLSVVTANVYQSIANNIRINEVNLPSVVVAKTGTSRNLTFSGTGFTYTGFSSNPNGIPNGTYGQMPVDAASGADGVLFNLDVVTNGVYPTDLMRARLNIVGDLTHEDGNLFFSTPFPQSVAQTFAINPGYDFRIDVADDFTVLQTADYVNDLNSFINVGGDLRVNGTAQTGPTAYGTGALLQLTGAFVMDGMMAQNVFQRQSVQSRFHDFVVAKMGSEADEDVELLSNLVIGGGYVPTTDANLSDGVLGLIDGNIEANGFMVRLMNPSPDGLQANRTTFGAVVGGGANSFVEGMLSRMVSSGTSSGGEVDDIGYLFPVGVEMMNGVQFYRPFVLDLPSNVANTREVTVSAYGMMPTSNNGLPLNVAANVNGGTISLDRKADAAWCVTFNANPALNPNIRVGAQGLTGINDIERIRLIGAAAASCSVTTGAQIATDAQWQLAGVYDMNPGGSGDDASANENDYIDGIPTLVQEGVQLWSTTNRTFPLSMVIAVASQGSLDPITIGENPGSGSNRVASVQIIHAVPDGGRVDVYVNGMKGATLDYLMATSFVSVPVNARVEVYAANADTSVVDPVFSQMINLNQDQKSVYILAGTLSTTDNVPLTIIAQQDARMTSTNMDQVQFAFAHAMVGGPVVNVIQRSELNAAQEIRFLANNLAFGQITGYYGMEPGNLVFSVQNGNNVVDYFRFPLAGREGKTYTFVLASDRAVRDSLVVYAFDAMGNRLSGSVVTANENPSDNTLPQEFALKGNYPNPFNPSTTISFDLPATADVSIDVVDMLGRRVMTVPVQSLSAGANRTVQIDAASLASGTYLYRVTAKMANATKVQTGRMTLVK